jgi:hypothetical protein
MVIFPSYVSLPEGKVIPVFWWYTYFTQVKKPSEIQMILWDLTKKTCGHTVARTINEFHIE